MNLIKNFFRNNEEVKEKKFEISNDDFEKRKEKFIDRTSKNDNFLYLKMDKYDLGEFLFPTIFAAINSEGKERIFDIKEDKYMPFEFAKLKLSSLESKDKFKVVIEEIKFIGNDYGFNFELTLPFKDNMPEYKKASAS